MAGFQSNSLQLLHWTFSSWKISYNWGNRSILYVDWIILEPVHSGKLLPYPGRFYGLQKVRRFKCNLYQCSIKFVSISLGDCIIKLSCPPACSNIHKSFTTVGSLGRPRAFSVFGFFNSPGAFIGQKSTFPPCFCLIWVKSAG